MKATKLDNIGPIASAVFKAKYEKKEEPREKNFNNAPSVIRTKEIRILKNRLDCWFDAWKRLGNKNGAERSLIQMADHKAAYYSILRIMLKYDLSKKDEDVNSERQNEDHEE